MERPARIELYIAALKKWGVDAQMTQLIEEMSELTTAILHRRRKVGIEESVIEELADVEIMVEQAKLIINKPKEFDMFKERKLAQLHDRVHAKYRTIKK